MNELEVPATATHIRDRRGAAGHSGKLFRVLGTARGRALSQAGGPWGGAGFRAQIGCGVLQGVREPGGGFQTAQRPNPLGLEHLLSAAAGRTDWGSGGCFQREGHSAIQMGLQASMLQAHPWQSEGHGGHEEEWMVQIYSEMELGGPGRREAQR